MIAIMCIGMTGDEDEENTLEIGVKLRCEEANLECVRNSQVLYFDRNFGNNDVRLIELSPELLKTLNEEKQFVLRGEGPEDAVLCTSDKSYSLKECTTSNSLLLLPELSTDASPSDVLQTRTVSSTTFVYYELKLCRAKLDKLREVLDRCAYCGEEAEVAEKGNKCTLADLLGTIQSSEEELRSGLDELGALEYNGYWRTIEHEYKTSAMSRILTLLEEKEWSWEKVPLISSCHTLSELQPCFVTELCLRIYGAQVEEVDDEVYIKLSEDKVCRFYGEYILSSTAGKFNLSEFMEVWQDSLPDGMTAVISHLRGLALVNRSSTPHIITYLPASDLPNNPANRFSFLFGQQDKWHQDDIIPYLEDLIGPGQTVNSLLLKHCRSTTDHKTKKKIYNSKVRS